MSLSNSAIFLSQNNLNSMEFTFLLRSTFDHEHQYPTVNSEEEEEKDDTKSESRLPFSEGFKVEEDNNGFKTPTSLDHKIPTALRCPMAPRKPRSRPITKRKTVRQRKMLRDLSNEIQSLFPAEFLLGLGGKIKRVRPVRD